MHPTGSLKHRLARSLVLYGLCNNWIQRGTTLVEASSGSTAVSEAYFARLLGLPFVAVMPASVVREKCDLIGFYGGRCHLVEDPAAIYDEARATGAGVRRALPGPVHLRRTGDRLARQQQHRRVDVRPAAAGAGPGADLGGRRRGYRRHERDHRPLSALSAVPDPPVRGGSGRFGLLPGLEHGRPYGDRPRFADRGDRPTADGAELHPRGGGPDDRGPRRGQRGGDALVHGAVGSPGRRIDRHQPVGCGPADRGDGRRRRAGERGHPDLRRRAALRAHLLRRRLGGGPGLGPGPVRGEPWRRSCAPAPSPTPDRLAPWPKSLGFHGVARSADGATPSNPSDFRRAECGAASIRRAGGRARARART